MDKKDLGIDPVTGVHNQVLTATENRFLGILWVDHVGRGSAISADLFALEFDGLITAEEKRDPDLAAAAVTKARAEFPEELGQLKRDIRTLHNHLLTRHDRLAILSAAGRSGGYFMADSDEEAAAFYDAFRRRGLTGLVKASRGKQAVMVEIMTQLSFDFEGLSDAAGMPVPVKRTAGMPAPVQIVDAFLGRMMQQPEQFADGLAKIGRKYSAVLLPKGRVEAVRSKVAELQALMRELGDVR